MDPLQWRGTQELLRAFGLSTPQKNASLAKTNGEEECFMTTLVKCMRAATVEHKN